MYKSKPGQLFLSCPGFFAADDAAAPLKNAIPPLKYWHLTPNGKNEQRGSC